MSTPPSDRSPVAVADLYDGLAEGYDHSVLGLFPFVADHLLRRLAPRPGAKLLDVGAGTGAVALAAAPLLAPGGRVTAVDISEGMLARLQAQALRMGLANVDVHPMDAGQLEFRRAYFDYVIASFVLCQLPAPEEALAGWLRVLKPGGALVLATLGAGAFAPVGEDLRSTLAELGAPVEEAPGATPEGCRSLLEGAGAVEVEVAVRDFGYHLAHVEEWWQLIWSSGLVASLRRLDPVALGALRRGHLGRVAALAGAGGIALSIPVCIARGRAP